MRIGIIGSGRIGGALGVLWARAGHDVMFGGSAPDKLAARVSQTGGEARAGSTARAAAFGEVLLLATPWPEVGSALRQVGAGLDGKVLIDATNPYGEASIPVVAEGSSASVAAAAPKAKVVKSFNTLPFDVLDAHVAGGGARLSYFVAGDDDAARAVTMRLVSDSGFDAVDAGPLSFGAELQPGRELYNRPMDLATARDTLVLATARC